MRIGIDARALAGERTGIGVYTENIARNLARSADDRIVLFTPRPIDLPAELPAAVSLSVNGGGPGTLWLHARLPGALERAECDVLLAALTIAPARPPIPTVPVVHDLTPLTHPEWHRNRTVAAFAPWIERTVAEAARLIAVSHATAAELAALFPETSGRVDVIANGVEERFHPASDDAAVRERRAMVTRGRPYILFVGTLEPRKNILRLVGACERLWSRRPESPDLLLAGGDGWKSEPLLVRIASSPFRGRIHRAGYVRAEELPDLYRAAEIFCYPSLAEGFGLPVLESMACGVPAVVSKAPALLEVTGDAAVAVAAEDEEGLASALERLLEDEPLRRDLSRRGAARAARFSWKVSGAKTAATLAAARASR